LNKQLTFSMSKMIITIIMALLGIIFLLPFFWMISTSFKIEADVFTYPIQWVPPTWNVIENYTNVWSGDYPFVLYYWNSIKVTLTTTFTSVIVSALAAYSFARINFKGKSVVFLLVLATFMVPTQAILVPQFVLYRWLGLFDSHVGLILLGSFSVLGTFLLRQFFMGIHNEIIESAKIDGANHLRIFRSMAVPLIRPGIATYAILRFIWTWNDYQYPLIFIRSNEQFTIQLGLRRFADEFGSFYTLIMAGAVSAIVPLLIIFIIGQKSVIEGIAGGSIKG